MVDVLILILFAMQFLWFFALSNVINNNNELQRKLNNQECQINLLSNAHERNIVCINSLIRSIDHINAFIFEIDSSEDTEKVAN